MENLTVDYLIAQLKTGKNAWNKLSLEYILKSEKSNNTQADCIFNFSNLSCHKIGIDDFSGYIFPPNTSFKNFEFNFKTSFKNCHFLGFTDFRGAKFQSGVDFDSISHCKDSTIRFDSAVFNVSSTFRDACLGEAYFTNAIFDSETHFDRTIFMNDAWFSKSFENDYDYNKNYAPQFSKGATFNNCEFEGEAWFSEVKFGIGPQILESTFHGWFRFDDVTINGGAQFSKCTFEKRTVNQSKHGKPGEGGAWFVGTEFKGQAWLDEITFKDDVTFQAVIFNHDAFFKKTKFFQSASFLGAESKRTFVVINTEFHRVPEFVQTHFLEAPILDTMEIFSSKHGIMHSLRNLFKKFNAKIAVQTSAETTSNISEPHNTIFTKQIRLDASDSAQKPSQRSTLQSKWRALRRLAVQGHDHEKELSYFASELWSYPTISYKFAFGLIYYILSNHGRSILRPLILFLLLTLFSTFFYYNHAVNIPAATPEVKRYFYFEELSKINMQINIGSTSYEIPINTTLLKEALKVSLRNAFLDIFMKDIDNNKYQFKTYGTLYGYSLELSDSNSFILVHNIPGAVLGYSLFHKISSTFLLFLFGLGLRNTFRIK